MKKVQLLVLFCSGLMAISCSSNSKQAEGPAGGGSASPAVAPADDNAVLERYSLQELDAAQTALKAVASEAAKSYSPGTSNVGTTQGAERPATETEMPASGASGQVLSCAVTGEEASRMQRKLASLIEQKLTRERDYYTSDPNTYARTAGFETCAAKCNCGILATLLKPISEKSLPQRKEKNLHRRYLSRLQAKAQRQTADDTLTCGRRQNWFCTSELKAFLEKN